MHSQRHLLLKEFRSLSYKSFGFQEGFVRFEKRVTLYSCNINKTHDRLLLPPGSVAPNYSRNFGSAPNIIELSHGFIQLREGTS